jgi:hypothetical protein
MGLKGIYGIVQFKKRVLTLGRYRINIQQKAKILDN